MTAPNLADTVQSSEAKVLATILQAVREDLSEVKDSVRGMSDALSMLTRLEVEHRSTREAMQRSFDAVGKLEQQFVVANRESVAQRDELDRRVHAVERAVPEKLTERVHTLERELGPLKEVRTWVVSGVIGCVGLTLLALAAMVIRPPAPITVTLPAEMVSKAVPK